MRRRRLLRSDARIKININPPTPAPAVVHFVVTRWMTGCVRKIFPSVRGFGMNGRVVRRGRTKRSTPPVVVVVAAEYIIRVLIAPAPTFQLRLRPFLINQLTRRKEEQPPRGRRIFVRNSIDSPAAGTAGGARGRRRSRLCAIDCKMKRSFDREPS